MAKIQNNFDHSWPKEKIKIYFIINHNKFKKK